MAAIRIGLLIPREGAAGLWAPSALACARLAVHEINQRDGLLGRPVELLTFNAGHNADSAVDAVDMAIHVDDVDAIVGCFPSYARRSVTRRIGGRVPFVYTPQYEGYENDRTVVAIGETAHDLLTPALDWIISKKRARRFFLCGNDYIWPRSTLATARAIVAERACHVVGEMLLPLETTDYSQLIETIRRSGADVVVPYFLGSDSIQFNRAFAEAGLAGKVLRLTSAVDETVLYGLSENATENLYVASGYFGALRSRNNGAFLERYHTLYGDNPPPANSFGQSCYEGVHSIAALADAAGSLRTSEVLRRMGRSHLKSTARGADPRPVTGSAPAIHLARADGYDFTVLTPA
ncbi:MAG: substrate-binding domain-containing protein [Alsobacter sp.]